ncbi:hypothetical protein KCU99_g390, partial [Aureobasidium melanogenum]
LISVAARGRLNGNRISRSERLVFLVASLAALCSSQLVHLCDALLELFVLALFGEWIDSLSEARAVGGRRFSGIKSNTIEERVCRAGCKMAGVGAQAGLGRLQEALGVATEGRRTGRRTSFEADGMLDCFGNGHGCDCVLTWITTAPAMTLDAVAGRQLSRAKARSIDRVFLVCRIKGCIAIILASARPCDDSSTNRRN